MKLVDPHTKTTLLITRHYDRVVNFITARAAMRQLIAGRVKGMDKDGNVATWDGVDPDVDLFIAPESSMSWKNNTMALHEDQPYLRSAPNPDTGEETRWAIPTICVCNRHYGYRPKQGESVPLRKIYSIYKGICQYCFEWIPYAQATKDHVYPKDMGGSNHDFNIVLACRKCNNAKDNIYPYYNKHGKIPVPVKLSHYHNLLDEMPTIREEWKPFLFLK